MNIDPSCKQVHIHVCITVHNVHVGTPGYYALVADHQRAIIYTDFVKDVAPLALALRERGIDSWSYTGKNMSSHDKVKAVDTWCPEDSSIQVHVCFG